MKKTIPSKLLLALLIFSFTHLQAQHSNIQNKDHQLFVSGLKTKVFYVGLDNPVEVIVPGVADKDLYVTISDGGVITRDTAYPHAYNVYGTGVGECEIKVAAKINGKITDIGSEEFRIKNIPQPVVWTNGNLKSGGVPVDKMKEQLGIKCMLLDFDFDCKFSITSYSMTFISNGKVSKAQTTGPVFSSTMKMYIQQTKPGDVIFFEDIKVMGPAKQTRTLNNIAFYIQ